MNVDQKLDKIVDTLGQQAVTLERLTVTVEDHVRRTNVIEEDIKPIKTHVWMVQGGFKLLILASILAAIAEGLAAWLRH
jgi:hypothetical protein